MSAHMTVANNGSLLHWYFDGEKLLCTEFKFDKIASAFSQVAEAAVTLRSAKYPDWSLLKCNVVTDTDTFTQVPVALLNSQSKSKESFKLFTFVDGQLKLTSNWKSVNKEQNVRPVNENTVLASGPSVLTPHGKYLIHQDREFTEGWETSNLARYFKGLETYSILSTRLNYDRSLNVLIRYKKREQGTLTDKLGLFMFDKSESFCLRWCIVIQCIPRIYCPIVRDVAFKRLTLMLDEEFLVVEERKLVKSEVFAITTANQIVRFVDGELKECGEVDLPGDVKMTELKIFSANEKWYGCVMRDDGKCVIVDLCTFAIVDHLDNRNVADIFIGDFLGIGTEQAVIARDCESPHLMRCVITDGSTWRLKGGRGAKLKNKIDLSEPDTAEVDENSKTAMKALSSRIMSGRGHLLEMKDDLVLREKFIQAGSGELKKEGKCGDLVEIQDDLLNPFGPDKGTQSAPQTHSQSDSPLKVKDTWVRHKYGNIIFGAVVINNSSRPLENLQLIVTPRNGCIGGHVKTQSRLILIDSESNPRIQKSIAKKAKRDIHIGMQDVCISTTLPPGRTGHVINISPRNILKKGVSEFDGLLSWHTPEGPLWYDVPTFIVKISDLVDRNIDVNFMEYMYGGGDLYGGGHYVDFKELEQHIAFFSTMTSIDLVLSSKISRISDLESIFKDVPLVVDHENWNFWYDQNDTPQFPCISKVSEDDRQVVLNVFFSETAQLVILLAHLYDFLPRDVDIEVRRKGNSSSSQADLLKSLHKEAAAVKNQLTTEKGKSPAGGTGGIDFSAGVDAVRHQVELQKERLLKRKASDEQTVDVLSHTIADLQVETDVAASLLF